MDSIFGIVGKNFTLLIADKTQARSIITQKTDENKILQLDTTKAVALAGEYGDRDQFTQYIKQNIKFRTLSAGLPMSTTATANFTRHELAMSLRKKPYMCNLMLGGVDGSGDDAVPKLFYIDYLGSLQDVKFGAQGYCSNFIYSIFDRFYRDGMNEEECVDLAKKCVFEIQKRLVVQQAAFSCVKITDAGLVELDINE